MRRKLVIAAILLQFMVLFFICGKRERIVRSGETVYLRTAPVDPRDIFRGDYVRLSYEISSVAPALQKGIDRKDLHKGMVLYGVLKKHDNSLAELVYLTPEEPDEGLYIKGWYQDNPLFAGPVMQMKYGIEAYFVQQGKGREMEKKMGTWWEDRDRAQTPMEIQCAIGGDGTAVITGHRWSPLAHSIEIDWKDDPRTRWRGVIRVKYMIKNVSGKAIALVNLPGYGSFTVEPQGITAFVQRGREREWIPGPVVPARQAPRDEHVVLLQPDEKRSFTLDFTDPKLYFKNREGKSVPVSVISTSQQRFRIVYRAPSKEECAGLKKRDLVWHGYLPSRAFTGSGYID